MAYPTAAGFESGHALHLNEGRSIEQFVWTVQCSYPYFILEGLALSGFPTLIHYPQNWTPDVKKTEIQSQKIRNGGF